MPKLWNNFFNEKSAMFFQENIRLALLEDGMELTAKGIFDKNTFLTGILRAKETTLVAGLPIIGLVLKAIGLPFKWTPLVKEGELVKPMTHLAKIEANFYALLKAERVILNYMTHLSGIANLVSRYVRQLEGTGVRLLDTRKTLPGLRWPEKYATQLAGCVNHRMDLTEMLMLKDNHIDAIGSIRKAVDKLRKTYNECPPIEVECRTIEHVKEAVSANVERIMLDNMGKELLSEALPFIPENIEAEVSGGVTLDNIREIALVSPRRPDYISVGRLTHSAKAADLSLMILNNNQTA